MKKTALYILLIASVLMLCGCEALSLSENAQPYFTSAEYPRSEQYYKDYYYPTSNFENAPQSIFEPLNYGAEYLDKPLMLDGVIKETLRVDGVKYFLFSTSYGDIYISNTLFTLDKLKENEKLRIYFVYSGYNKSLEAITGAYVSYYIQ